MAESQSFSSVPSSRALTTAPACVSPSYRSSVISTGVRPPVSSRKYRVAFSVSITSSLLENRTSLAVKICRSR
jgi:hypothetical protein